MRCQLLPRHGRGLSLLTALVLAGASARPAVAQKDIPKRPELPAGADTNSPAAYHQLGLSSLRTNPRRAADAFYWAGRLDPSAGSVQYARYVAQLLENKEVAVRYWLGDEGLLRSKDIRRIDSLAYRAFLRDPFLSRQLFAHITQETVYQITGRAVLIRSNEYPEMNARQAYERGDFADAADWYAKAIKKYPRAYSLRDARADAFFLSGKYDSAVSELQLVLEAQRKRDAKKLVYAYESKAFTEFKIGWALAHKGDIAGAREAYGRALTEDIAFWRAHEALADVALEQGDTAIALQEFDLATQIATADPVLLEKYALLLETQGRNDDAAAALARAVAAEPFFSRPYFHLGRLAEVKGDKPTAIARYQAFLARVEQGDDKAELAKEQLASLGVTVSR